ncbi:hypothetical protein OURE66S_01540 [Oligella ureolytica]
MRIETDSMGSIEVSAGRVLGRTNTAFLFDPCIAQPFKWGWTMICSLVVS